jgi:hypothetical protein
VRRLLWDVTPYVLSIAILVAGVVGDLPLYLVVLLSWLPILASLVCDGRRISRQIRKAAAQQREEAEQRAVAAEKAAVEERVVASAGRFRLLLNGRQQLFLEDEQRPERRTALSSPDDATFSELEVAPITVRVQPDGYVYSREYLASSIDPVADLVCVLFRVNASENSWGHWEYSHKSAKRYRWSASTGAFSGAEEVAEPPIAETRTGDGC